MIDEPMLQILKAAIGDDPNNFYLRRFSRYCKNGLPLVDFHLAGALFGIFWFLYRQIWFVVTPFLVLMISVNYLVQEPLFFYVGFAIFLVTQLLGALWGVQLYFLWVSSEIRRMKKRGKNEDEIIRIFRQKGGTIVNRQVG